MNNKKYIFFEVFLPLFLASLLYLFFRPVDTVIYKISDFIGLSPLVDDLRSKIIINAFPEWFVYSLPGALWLLAFQNTLTWIKGFKGRRLIHLVLLASFTGVGLELLQAFHWTDGRFDWIDIIFYSIATLLSLSNIWLIRKRWEIYPSSKTSPRIIGFAFVAFTVMIYLADIV